MYSQITFSAPVRERGPRKFKCTFSMKLFASKLLKAVCDGHAYLNSVFTLQPIYDFAGLCFYALHTFVPKARDIIYRRHHPVPLQP